MTVVALAEFGLRVPEAPPASLDPFLDAAARCFARHGVKRTSVQDVAQELRVNRTTVYRQVGSIEHQVRLLLSRELHRLLTELPTRLVGGTGPDAIVELLDTVVSFARRHPVLRKVLADEPDLIGPFLVADLPEFVDRVVSSVTPLLEAAMDRGDLAPRDPRIVAEWLVRLCGSLILAPPPGDLRTFLRELLVPALSPTPAPRRKGRT